MKQIGVAAPPAAAFIDPITIEVIGSAFTSIVEEMGEALVRASYSTNIKERRDCSTALFDVSGTTLCQAEHIPTHLGSFLDFVPSILKRHAVDDIMPGDTFIGNDAFEGGGTHLPDIVLATPVFVDGTLMAWALNTGTMPISPTVATRTSTRKAFAFHPSDSIARAYCRRTYWI